MNPSLQAGSDSGLQGSLKVTHRDDQYRTVMMCPFYTLHIYLQHSGHSGLLNKPQETQNVPCWRVRNERTYIGGHSQFVRNVLWGLNQRVRRRRKEEVTGRTLHEGKSNSAAMLIMQCEPFHHWLCRCEHGIKFRCRLVHAGKAGNSPKWYWKHSVWMQCIWHSKNTWFKWINLCLNAVTLVKWKPYCSMMTCHITGPYPLINLQTIRYYE